VKSVNLSDLSHSYPFLHLSRKLGVPYERVLAAADLIDSWADFGNSYLLADAIYTHCLRIANQVGMYTDQVRLVARVCVAPWRWQFPPEGRGL